MHSFLLQLFAVEYIFLSFISSLPSHIFRHEMQLKSISVSIQWPSGPMLLRKKEKIIKSPVDLSLIFKYIPRVCMFGGVWSFGRKFICLRETRNRTTERVGGVEGEHIAKIWRVFEKVPRAIEFTFQANCSSMLGSNVCIAGLCKIKETQVNCTRFSIVYIKFSTNAWIQIPFTRETAGHLNNFSFRNETYTCVYICIRGHIFCRVHIPQQATWKMNARGFLFQF